MNGVILQPSYIPWRGYFHQIRKADVFVFLDDVQYDSRGWRNRNRIKCPEGVRWLSIPVHHRGCQVHGTPIHAIPICWDQPWNRKHWQTIERAYSKAPYFERFASTIQALYDRRPTLLAEFTIETTMVLAGLLGIEGTRFIRSSELNVTGAKTDRLLAILQAVGATHYISGPSAEGYLETEKLAALGVSWEYMRYEYPEYPQLYPPYDPQVSVLDLLFMVGPAASSYIWGGE